MKLSLKEMIKDISEKCDKIMELDINDHSANLFFQEFTDIQIFMHEFIENVEKNT